MTVDHVRMGLLASQQRGLLRLDQIVECGMSKRAVQRRAATGAFPRVRHGVYAIGHVPDDPETSWSAAVLAAGADAALSHLAAARMWNLLPWHPHRIDVTRGTSRRDLPGVVCHTSPLADHEVSIVRGVRVTSPSRTIADCSQLLDEDTVTRLLREARHLGMLDSGALASHCQKRHGAPRLRTALARHRAGRAGFRSRLEQDVRNVLVTRGAPEPIINARHATHIGTVEVDQSWPDLMVCLEIDGPTHDARDQQDRDAENSAALRRAGWSLYRVHWQAFAESATRATDPVIDALNQAIQQRATLSVADVEIAVVGDELLPAFST